MKKRIKEKPTNAFSEKMKTVTSNGNALFALFPSQGYVHS